jgi:hypothetical protein
VSNRRFMFSRAAAVSFVQRLKIGRKLLFSSRVRVGGNFCRRARETLCKDDMPDREASSDGEMSYVWIRSCRPLGKQSDSSEVGRWTPQAANRWFEMRRSVVTSTYWPAAGSQGCINDEEKESNRDK